MTDQVQTYRTVLGNWDARSGVRSKARVMLSDRNAGKSFFSRRLTPIAEHERVTRLSPRACEEILTRRLYSYFDFTTVLEQEIVNPVLVSLAKGELISHLSPAMRTDAHRIYVDEAYHALSAVDLNIQVEEATGIRYEFSQAHRFQQSMRQRLEDTKDINPALVMLCAATVSETLISGTLSQVPQDESVVSAIRDAIAEHAEDERHHHAYFTKVHQTVWPQLTSADRKVLAPMYADFILGFLLPDIGAQCLLLEQSGLRYVDAQAIAHESYEASDSVGDARHAARATIQLLRRTGVLEEPGAVEYFNRSGLVI